MKLRWAVGLVVLAAGGWFLWPKGEAIPTVQPAKVVGLSDCNSIVFQGKRFTECLAIPGQHKIAMRITGKNGVIYRGFTNLAQDYPADTIAFAINGGMYDTGSEPIGYYVEDEKRLHPLNTRDAGGNFYLKPNGVFFGDPGGGWRVLASDEFAAQITDRPKFATQSGPMLMIGGKLHPQISENGTSLKLRNGVGIDQQGRAHFVISDEPVSFGTLALLMRDHVKASEALFLDGTVSSLWHPAGRRMDSLYPLGPLIVVTRVQ